MNRYVVPLLLWFSCFSQAATESVRVFFHEIRSYDMTVTEFEDLPKLSYGKPVHNADNLPWLDAYRASQRFGEYEFADWIKFNTDGYLAENKIDAERFEKARERFSLEKAGHKEVTVLHTIEIRGAHDHHVVVAFYNFGFLTKRPARYADLDYAVNLVVFTEAGGRWKRDTLDAIHPFDRMPVGQIEVVLDDLGHRHLYMNHDNDLVPLNLEEFDR